MGWEIFKFWFLDKDKRNNGRQDVPVIYQYLMQTFQNSFSKCSVTLPEQFILIYGYSSSIMRLTEQYGKIHKIFHVEATIFRFVGQTFPVK